MLKRHLILFLLGMFSIQTLKAMVGKEPDFIKTLTKEQTLIHLKQILY